MNWFVIAKWSYVLVWMDKNRSSTQYFQTSYQTSREAMNRPIPNHHTIPNYLNGSTCIENYCIPRNRKCSSLTSVSNIYLMQTFVHWNNSLYWLLRTWRNHAKGKYKNVHVPEKIHKVKMLCFFKKWQVRTTENK